MILFDRLAMSNEDKKVNEVKTEAEVIQLFGTPKDISEQEIQALWNFLRGDGRVEYDPEK